MSTWASCSSGNGTTATLAATIGASRCSSPPAQKRTRDLADWLGRFATIGQAIQLILQLVRDSTILKPVTAESGFYQKTLDSNHPCQLVRVEVDQKIPCYAEISGGRHRFTVRFLELSKDEGHLKQSSDDVNFRLGCCII